MIDFIGFSGLFFLFGGIGAIAFGIFQDYDSGVFGGLASASIGIVLLMTAATMQNGRLMDECLADGRKEYECRSILRAGSLR